MKEIVKKHSKKLQYASPFLVLGALSFAVFGFGGNANNLNNSPFITDFEPFVLVAGNSMHLSEGTQISSGNMASNKSIQAAENAIINGNLFSDRIQLAENTSINGNVTSNRLNKAETTEIFGEVTDIIQKNIVEPPSVPNFQTGTLSHLITEDTTLNPGNYNEITISVNATLTLIPGTYNLNKLILKDNSKLLYSDATVINVKDQLKIQNNTLIASNNPNSDLTTELQLNYIGKPPLIIGDSSFVTAKILSPDSRVQIGNKTTFRGQILAKDVNVGEEGVLSREIGAIKETDPEKVIIDEDGSVYPLNEIVVNFTDEATFADAQEVADLVGGQVVGFMQLMNAYQLEVAAQDPEDLDSKIQNIKSLSSPLIEGVFRNFLLGIE